MSNNDSSNSDRAQMGRGKSSNKVNASQDKKVNDKKVTPNIEYRPESRRKELLEIHVVLNVRCRYS